MTTYRTGNHWGVTIVREGERAVDYATGRREDDQLVAVVVNGDQELAERICALLNADALVGGMWCETCEREIRPGDTYAYAPGTGGLVHCGEHAANLGELSVLVSASPSPVAAQEPSAGGNGWAEASKGLSEALKGFTVGGDSAGYEGVWISHDECVWNVATETPVSLAELVQRAGKHTEVCR